MARSLAPMHPSHSRVACQGLAGARAIDRGPDGGGGFGAAPSSAAPTLATAASRHRLSPTRGCTLREMFWRRLTADPGPLAPLDVQALRTPVETLELIVTD